MQVAATKPSLTFFQPEDIRKQGVDVWVDDDEWDVRLCPVPSVRSSPSVRHTVALPCFYLFIFIFICSQ